MSSSLECRLALDLLQEFLHPLGSRHETAVEFLVPHRLAEPVLNGNLKMARVSLLDLPERLQKLARGAKRGYYFEETVLGIVGGLELKLAAKWQQDTQY